MSSKATLARELASISRPNSHLTPQLREIPEKGARQYGRFVMVRQSLNQPKGSKDSKEKEGDKRPAAAGEWSDDGSLNRDVRFELHDVINDKLVWSWEFRKEAPKLFFDDYSGRRIFYRNLGSEAEKARMKEEVALAERARQMGNKDDDYLVEVYDAFCGEV